MKKTNDPKGFSLVEIMVAMTIWAVVILGFFSAMIWLSSHSNTQDLRARANALADQAITIAEGLAETDSLIDTPPEVLEEIFTHTLQIDPVGWDETELKFKVNPGSPASGRRVTTTILWQDSTGEHEVSRTHIVF